MTKPKYPFSVIDGTKVRVKEAFSWILNYYDPNKKHVDKMSNVLDTTCSEMLMWDLEDLKIFNVDTNDIRMEIKAKYHYNCIDLAKHLQHNKYDIILYDPPYINLKNRKDTEKYEKAFDYDSVKDIETLNQLTKNSSDCFSKLINNTGILIIKITNFHWNGQIYGSYNMKEWFSNHFYLFDEIIYRFFKPIPNLNFYNRKVAKTHTYFMMFKKNKKLRGKKLW